VTTADKRGEAQTNRGSNIPLKRLATRTGKGKGGQEEAKIDEKKKTFNIFFFLRLRVL
jgi:hypothetical protein